MRWESGVFGWVLGVHDGFVYVAVSDAFAPSSEIRALTVADGTEFWRASLENLGTISDVYGISDEGIALFCLDKVSNLEHLVLVNRNGQVVWSVSGDDFDTSYGWMVKDAITTSHNGYDNWRFETIYPETGNMTWQLIPNTYRWNNVSDQPVLCAGKAYALVEDSVQQNYKKLLVIVDLVKAEVMGAWDSLAIPMFIADGILLAQDNDTNEILAIGPVPAVLQAGGRAAVTRDVTLRGAPSDAAIERGQVTTGTLVDVTGEGEASNGTEWMPVAVHDTGESGWLPADALAGQDGPIRFLEIDIHEFGEFTSSP